MKMVVKTGLVPVKLLKSDGAHSANRIVGYIPEKARRAIEAGDATLEGVEEHLVGIETIEVDDPIAKPAAASTAKPAEVKTDKPVEIPEDWAKLHHLKRIELAEKIVGEKIKADEGGKVSEKADTIITDELARRAAAEKPAPAAA